MLIISEKTKRQIPLRPLLGKQNVQAKEFGLYFCFLFLGGGGGRGVWFMMMSFEKQKVKFIPKIKQPRL